MEMNQSKAICVSVFCLTALISSAFAQSTSGPQPPAFVGDIGQIIETAMGCPNQDDVKTFIDSFESAQQATDTVGEQNAVMTALQSGCRTLRPGDQGLVIDASGFFEGWTKIRMNDDEQAYWTIREAVGDVSGPMHPNQ